MRNSGLRDVASRHFVIQVFIDSAFAIPHSEFHIHTERLRRAVLIEATVIAVNSSASCLISDNFTAATSSDSSRS